MKAIILAAGKGTRLHPYTLDRPKCMVEIDGQSLISRQLHVLDSESVDPVILVGGYRADMLPQSGVEVRINTDYASTNMLWSLYTVLDELKSETIVSYGDIVYSQNILRQVKESKADISVAIDTCWESYWNARSDDPISDAETLKMDVSGRILDIGNKPESIKDIEGQYMGLIKVSKNGADTLRDVIQSAVNSGVINNKPVKAAYLTDLLQDLIHKGLDVHSVPIDDDWVEVDTVSDRMSKITLERLRNISSSVNNDWS